MEYIPRQVSNSDVKDTTIDHTNVAESFIHLATAAPDKDDDEGTGFAVGCLWIDYSNGETYTCVGSTDEAAKWAAQDGSDDVNIFLIGGSTYGFHVGGGLVNNINRFTFASPSDSSDQAEMTAARGYMAEGSCRNTTHSFMNGGGSTPGMNSSVDIIERMALSAPYAGADVGELSQALVMAATATNGTKAIVAGGAPPPTTYVDQIEGYTLGGSPITSSDLSAELTAIRGNAAGVSDTLSDRMFIQGGEDGPPAGHTNKIEKIDFASTVDSTDWGDLQGATAGSQGSSSTTHGYSTGGAPASNTIEKFTYSTPANATDVGELTETCFEGGGCQSTTDGFKATGHSPGVGSVTDKIEKYSYSSDGNSSDVGESAESKRRVYGTEV